MGAPGTRTREHGFPVSLVRLQDLRDVDPSGLADGRVPIWDDARKKFVFHPGGASGAEGGVSSRQAMNVQGVTCPDSTWVTTALHACPLLLPNVTKMVWEYATEITPQAGCTDVYICVNEVQAPNGDQFGGNALGSPVRNFAFSRIVKPVIGDAYEFSYGWGYDPRLAPLYPEVPDVNLGDGAGKYLGLSIVPVGGSCIAFSNKLTTWWGDQIQSITIDASSVNRLDDSAPYPHSTP